MNLTRQQELWWCAPTLRYWRQRLIDCRNGSSEGAYEPDMNARIELRRLEGYDAPHIGGYLPVLGYSSNLGWNLRNAFHLTDEYKVPQWKKIGGLFQIVGDDKWYKIKLALQLNTDPAEWEEAQFGDDENSLRLLRFLAEAYKRFVSKGPEVASLWREGDQLMCGWDPIPPEDGRMPYERCPWNLPFTWFGHTERYQTDEWVWRVERTDLRYDGARAGEDYIPPEP